MKATHHRTYSKTPPPQASSAHPLQTRGLSCDPVSHLHLSSLPCSVPLAHLFATPLLCCGPSTIPALARPFHHRISERNVHQSLSSHLSVHRLPLSTPSSVSVFDTPSRTCHLPTPSHPSLSRWRASRIRPSLTSDSHWRHQYPDSHFIRSNEHHLI
jgi:hypothetical protein